jgi:preprotein translocase subunit SecG
MFGWIPWTLSLSYDTMLRGVPGTGTREGGLSGSMLKATLDGVVLIRFHAMCLRITALATVLFIVILMPVYMSAQCYGASEAEIESEAGYCAGTEYNLTNYEKTTLANVPSLLLEGGETHKTIASPGFDGTLARLYAVCFCFWILCGK